MKNTIVKAFNEQFRIWIVRRATSFSKAEISVNMRSPTQTHVAFYESSAKASGSDEKFYHYERSVAVLNYLIYHNLKVISRIVSSALVKFVAMKVSRSHFSL